MRRQRLDRLVTDWAARAPSQAAVDGKDQLVSYGELDALANRFAQALGAAGVAPGDRVGVHLPRSGRAIAAMLGAARAGAVYVPLDPSSPPARMKLIAADCGLRHVVIAPDLLANWIAAAACDGIDHIFLSAEAPTPGPRSRRRLPRHYRRPRTIPTTSPICSTPRAPPARPRA